MVCKFLKKVFRPGCQPNIAPNDRSSESRIQSSTPSEVPNPSNLVITVNVVGRNQHNYRSDSGPLPRPDARVPGPAVVDGYYTTTGYPAPYLHVYSPVFGVLNSPVLMSPVILMNVSGQPVPPSSPSHENQHQASPLNNRTACSHGRGDPNRHAGQTHTLRDVSTHIEHPVRVSETAHLERIPSYRPIASNCNCSRQYNPPSLPDFVVGSSTGPTVNRQSMPYETNLTARHQPCAHVSSQTPLPHLCHDPSHPTNKVDLSPSTAPPESPPSATHYFTCRKHPSRPGTNVINCNGIETQQLPNPYHCMYSGEMSKGTALHHTVSPTYPFRSRSRSLPTAPTVPELTRSPSPPVIIPPTIDGCSESHLSSPRPVP